MSSSTDVRHGWFTARSECPHCGQPLPLNGPVMNASCAYCLKDVSLPAAIWGPVLDAYDDLHMRLAPEQQHAETLERDGLRVRYEFGAGTPACEKCGSFYPVGDLTLGTARDFSCIQCGDPASTWPAPQWLLDLVPSARQIYSTQPGVATPTGSVQLEAIAKAVKPIAMACPTCGAGLEITGEDARIFQCKFCQADVYLPDEIWRRLHPVKTVQRFFVRFEGLSRTQRDAARKAKKVKARQEGEAMRRAADAEGRERARVRQEQARGALAVQLVKMTQIAWLFALAAGGVLALFAGWCWLAQDAKTWSPVDGDTWTVTLALGLASLGAVLVAMWAVSRPIQKATGNPFEWIIFVTWFWLPFAIMMPVIGQAMALVRVFILLRGKFGPSTITSGDQSVGRTYGEVTLENGEGRPGAFLYLCIALLWPLAFIGLSGGLAALFE